MNVQLRPELVEYIDEQVRRGSFSSPTEVLEAGLGRLMLDPPPDVLTPEDVAEIRASLEQMRRGEVIDGADFTARMRQKYLAK